MCLSMILQADKLERHGLDVSVNDLCVVCSNIPPLFLEAWCGGHTLQFYDYIIYTIHLQAFVLLFYS